MNRLVQILGRAGVHGCQVCVYFTIRGEDDDRDSITTLTERLEEVQAVALRHSEVGDDQVEVRAF